MKIYYRTTDKGLTYYTPADVSIMLYEAGIPERKFNVWITGSACPIVYNTPCYFSWDVEKFLSQQKVDFITLPFEVREQTEDKEIIDEF